MRGSVTPDVFSGDTAPHFRRLLTSSASNNYLNSNHSMHVRAGFTQWSSAAKPNPALRSGHVCISGERDVLAAYLRHTGTALEAGGDRHFRLWWLGAGADRYGHGATPVCSRRQRARHCDAARFLMAQDARRTLSRGAQHAAANHIRFLMDCAQICASSADFMSRVSPSHVHTCRVCADVCERCAISCEQLPGAEMRRCAEQCRRCAEECRRLSAAVAA